MVFMEREDLLSLYHQILLIRRFEEKSAEMYALAKIAGFLHLFTTRLPQEVVDRATYTSSFEHMRLFSAGLIDSRPIVYYVSFAIFFLVLTHRVLEFRKWKV